ncbi:MAG: hypothetical protein DHS20C15_22830 [Planctomycetota bacterium]|nr:MAG: hypothetical protein DHS20C15_22830 [Planctomycetota bacterium]
MSHASTSAAGSRVRLVILLLAIVALFAATKFLPVGEWMQSAFDGIEGLGAWGPAALVGLYIVACVLMLPGSVITLGAGAAFGVVQGSIAVFIGATLGATLAFLVGRYLARAQIEKKVAGNERFAAIDKAVGQQGFKIVVLTRLSPVFPFNLLNYAYGLTSVKLRDFVLGSVGMLPGTVMFVYLGHAGKAAAAAAAGEGSERTPAQWVLLGVGLLATLVVTVFVTKLAKRALDGEVDADLEDAEG